MSGYDSTIKIWDIITGKCKQTLMGYSTVKSLAVLHNGDLASALYNGTIQIWDLNTGECKETLFGHLNEVDSLPVFNNGYLVTNDGRIKIWNLRAYKRYKLPLKST